jgi:tetratricopeptide (TPR) repeat protein
MNNILEFTKTWILIIAMALSVEVWGGDLSQSNIKTGDIITQKNEKGEWSVVKVLEMDKWPDGTYAAHCLTYKAFSTKPTKASIKGLSVLIYHAPIDAKSFNKGWELLDNQPVVKEELVGFVEYLKQTDFPRYIKYTGQDPKEIVGKANVHYQRAYALGTDGKRKEAIEEYSKAIELFPLFYEAIDNRAFTYMELGDYQSALNDFEASLRVEPKGVAAFFSKGECLMKLGKLKEAEAVFKEGIVRFPEQKAMFNKFLNTTKSMMKKG